MNKTVKSVLALLLCVCMVLSAGITGAAVQKTSVQPMAQSYASIEDYVAQSQADITGTAPAGNAAAQSAAEPSVSATPVGKTTLGNIFTKIINFISDFFINKVVLGALRAVLPQSPEILDYDTFDLDGYGDFYAGTETFLDEAAQGAQWHLGYAQRSILPADFGTKKYVRGSLIPYGFTNETFDDLKVRTVVLDDGSGRGKTVFATIDCIGLANSDIRKIRAAVADFAAANNIVSINISASHTHSGIDSQGVWTDPATTVINNIFSSATGKGGIISGVDSTFLQTMVDQTAASIIEACGSMTAGTLSYAKKELSGYAYDRTPPYAFDRNLYRLEFVPFDQAVKPTIIATYGIHPEVTSYSFKTISGDSIYYMEEVINNAGFNFIFIQGSVSTTTSSRHYSNDGLPLNDHEAAVRYGYELGYITLGLTLTQTECAALNLQCGDLLGVQQYTGRDGYSVWYENWVPVSATPVAPLLNIRMEQFLIKSDNNVSNVLSKISLANNRFLYQKSTRTYYTVTELGYMEIGNGDLQVFLSPGELMGELLTGGPGLYGFKYPSLRETYGENLIVFDLMNDAVGYVAADPNYVMVGYQYNEENDTYASDTWCLLVSLGKHTASTLFERFAGLVDSVR